MNELSLDNFAQHQEEMAATTIQATYKGFKTRQSMLMKDNAARTIQKNFKKFHRNQQLRDELASEMNNLEMNYSEMNNSETNVIRNSKEIIEERPKGYFMSWKNSFTNLFNRKSEEVFEESVQGEKGRGDNWPKIHADQRGEIAQIGSLHNVIVISGGFNPDDVDHQSSGQILMLYDPETDEYLKVLDKEGKEVELPEPRHHHCMVHWKNFLYIIGGCNPNKTKRGKGKMAPVPEKCCHKFDIRSKMWERMESMRVCRMYHNAVILSDLIYVVGGKDERDKILDSVEVFNPSSGEWRDLKDPMEWPRMGAGVCVYGGQIWVIGGMTYDKQSRRDEVITSVACYSPKYQSWTYDVPAIPEPCMFATALQCGYVVYTIGGMKYENAHSNDTLDSIKEVFRYDARRRVWKSDVSLPSSRHFTPGVVLGESMWIFGGLVAKEETALDDVITLKKGEKSWVQRSQMPVPLCGFAVTSVPEVF